jgi:hypothetical protein
VRKHLLLLLVAAVLQGASPAPAAPEPAPPARGQPGPIPFKTDGGETDMPLGRIAAVVVLLLAAAWVAVYGLQRYAPQGRLLKRGSIRRLKLVETMRLAPRSWLYLVEYEEKTILLAQCGDCLTVIAASTGPAVEPFGRPAPG